MTTWLLFLLCATVILFAGTNLSRYGDIIAEKTGMGRTWIGVALMASVTSLPELITGVSAVALVGVPDIAAGEVVVCAAALRIGAVDLAVGNLFGSNLFNIAILGLDDLFYTEGSLLTAVSLTHLISALGAILLSSIAIIGMVFSVGRKVLPMAWDALAIFVAYLLVIATLYGAQL